MNPSQASSSTRFKVGVFTILALALIGALTVFVNDKPFWWRSCQLVYINIDDATGLKTKSPIRSLGLQIGYLKNVELYETHVRLGICITAPVEVLPSTRAYIRGEGFLGDKFVELKPVKFSGSRIGSPSPSSTYAPAHVSWLWRALVPDAYAAVERKGKHTPPAPSAKGGHDSQDIPVGEESKDVQNLVNQVDDLVTEMTTLTNNLKQAINPQELRQTMLQLNKTLENASRTLSPEGGLNTTAQRTLAKLEDSIEQLRDQMTRINKGEGSVGMLLNDPKYADEVQEALKNINRLLSKVGGVRFVVDMGATQVFAYNTARGWFKLGIWPAPDRYYLVGMAIDPRGTRTVTTTTTVSGGLTTANQTTRVDENSIVWTGMLGKVLWKRIDLAAGILYNEGTGSAGLRIGPHDREEMVVFRNDIYARGAGIGLDYRATLTVKPWARTPLLNPLYATGGIEAVHKVNGQLPWFLGAGITFDDEDIKILFALR